MHGNAAAAPHSPCFLASLAPCSHARPLLGSPSCAQGDQRLFVETATPKSFSWCTESAGWVVPKANANVTIPAGTTVSLSGCTTALVNKLDIFGTLVFVRMPAS